MNLYIDSGSIPPRFISEPTFKSQIDSLQFKRGDSAYINLNFVSGNTSLSAVSGVQIIFGAKLVGDYDGALVVSTSGYNIVNNSYQFSPNFNTTSINSYLSGDASSLTLHGEITWSNDNGATWTTTQEIPIVVTNDIIKLTEASPLPSQTFLDYIAAYAPQPLVLTAPPISYPGNMRAVGEMVASSEAVSWSDVTLVYAGLYNDRFSWTNDGLEVNFGTPQLNISWDNVDNVWIMRFYDYLGSYQAIDSQDITIPNNFVGSGGAADPVVTNSITTGKLGQDAIVESVKRCIRCCYSSI